MSLPSDTELFARAQELTKLLAGRKGVVRDERDDITQEVALALLRARDRFDPSLATWSEYSYWRAYRTIQDYFREHPRNGVKWDRTNGEAVYTESIDVAPWNAPRTYMEDSLILEDLLQELTPRERGVLLLMLMGYEPSQIASTLGIKPNTAYYLVYSLRLKSSLYFWPHHMDLPQLKRAA